MTKSDREAILEAMDRQRKAIAANPALARETLLRTGIYNKDGSLKSAYGGAKKKSAA